MTDHLILKPQSAVFYSIRKLDTKSNFPNVVLMWLLSVTFRRDLPLNPPELPSVLNVSEKFYAKPQRSRDISILKDAAQLKYALRILLMNRCSPRP